MLTETLPLTSLVRARTSDIESQLDDRREAQRFLRPMIAKLIAPGPRTFECPAIDISEGGLYVRVPAISGVMVGERYEVVISPESAPDQDEASTFATVVRTEIGTSDSVGVGMRFDQPLYL